METEEGCVGYRGLERKRQVLLFGYGSFNENQSRSFSCGLKHERQMIATQNLSGSKVVIEEKPVKNTSNDIENKEIDSELETLGQDFQDIEIALQEIEMLESFSMKAKMALQSSLLMNSPATIAPLTLRKNKQNIKQNQVYRIRSKSF